MLKKQYTEMEAKQINPLVLALIGDSVHETYVRMNLLDSNPNSRVNELHKKVVGKVKATAQSEFIKEIEAALTEEELKIYKRGRNTKSSTPKNANVQDYRNATGFEALIGYLYLTDQEERLDELYKIMF